MVTPPQVARLPCGRARLAATETGAERVLPLTLGVDHRALDGTYAARALTDLAEAIAS